MWARVKRCKATGKDVFYVSVLILSQWVYLFRVERAKGAGIAGAVQEAGVSLLGAFIISAAAWCGVAAVVLLGWAAVSEFRRWHRE